MPNLVYTVAAYTPFTKILSANANQDKTDIQSRVNWSGTAADVSTGLDGTNIQGVTAITAVNASLTTQGVTVTANPGQGSGGNSITLAFTGGGTAGSEVVSVVGTAISVQIQSGVSTVTQVVTALNATASAALAYISASGVSASTVATAGAINLTSGVTSGGLARASKLQLEAANSFIVNDATGAIKSLNSARNQTVYTNSSGVPTAGSLSIAAGGTGSSISSMNSGDVLQANAGLTAYISGPVPMPAQARVFSYNSFE